MKIVSLVTLGFAATQALNTDLTVLNSSSFGSFEDSRSNAQQAIQSMKAITTLAESV
jgi:hypothetical protein